jgi:hypothetical protein
MTKTNTSSKGVMDFLSGRDKKQYSMMRKIRGNFLGEATEVENVLAEAIATHFFPNFLFNENEFEEHKLLERTILGHRSFTFSAKADALQYILKQAHPDLYNKHKGTFVKLKKVIEHRNVLAHGYFVQQLPMPDFMRKQLEGPEQVMVETFSRGQVIPHFLTLKEANAKVKEAKEVSESLASIGGELMRRASASGTTEKN